MREVGGRYVQPGVAECEAGELPASPHQRAGAGGRAEADGQELVAGTGERRRVGRPMPTRRKRRPGVMPHPTHPPPSARRGRGHAGGRRATPRGAARSTRAARRCAADVTGARRPAGRSCSSQTGRRWGWYRRLLEMNRREAIKKGVAALGLGGLALSSFIRDTAVESSELALEAEELSLDPPTLERLRLQVVQFGLDYLHTPPKHLSLDVFAARREVKDLLRYKPNQAKHTELFALIGWLSGLLEHLAMDLGYHSAAQTHCEGGLRVAQVIGHHDAIAWIRGTQAMMATYTDRADEGVRYAQMGKGVARAGSTASVRLAAHEMRACARLGDRRGAEDAMQRAQEAMAALTEEPPRSILSFERTYLPFSAGTSYVWLEDAE